MWKCHVKLGPDHERRFENILKACDFFMDKTKFMANLRLDLKFVIFYETKKSLRVIWD